MVKTKKQHGGKRAGAGAPRQYEHPPQRIQIRATDEELARIKAALDGRRMTEAMLAACNQNQLAEWNDNLVKALAIIDEKGRGDGSGSVMLWGHDWLLLRALLLETIDAIKATR